MDLLSELSKYPKHVIRDEVERRLCENDLYEFVRAAWKYCDPTPFVDGLAIEAICQHLQACTDGVIKRLIVNIPPRMGKSSIISVLWPCWVWAQPPDRWSHTSGPGVQFLSTSFAKQLSIRDNLRMRRIILSDWYQKHWGDRFMLMPDQSAKGRFDNNKKGSRLGTSVGSALTGEGGSVIIIDDANSAQEAFSEAKITEVIDWYDNALSTRLNNPKLGVIVNVQQRLAVDDLTGHLLEQDAEGWTHLCLPMRFEKDRRTFNFIYGPDEEPWTDWRLKEGELLWPERFGEEEITKLEKTMGPTISAGQLQQRPRVKDGEIIKDQWWKLFEGNAYPPMDFIVASIDTAYTKDNNNDPSAMTVWGVYTQDNEAQNIRVQNRDGSWMTTARSYGNQNRAPRVMLMDAWSERLEFHELIERIIATARTNKVDMILIEKKASGQSISQEIRRIYGMLEFGVLEIGTQQYVDKIARLYSVQHLFAEGIVYAPDRQFAQSVIDQVSSFPKGKHDDLVDTVSMAMRYLRDAGMLIRTDEHTSSIAEQLKHKGRAPPPLYPV